MYSMKKKYKSRIVTADYDNYLKTSAGDVSVGKARVVVVLEHGIGRQDSFDDDIFDAAPDL